MALWSEIRRRIMARELSLRQASDVYHLNFRTVQKIARSTEPPAYSQSRPRPKPVLGRFLPIVHQILEEDRSAPPKQRHSARRIFERLRDEHGYEGCSSIVRASSRFCWYSRPSVWPHRPGGTTPERGSAAPSRAAMIPS